MPVAPTDAQIANRTYLQDHVEELVPALNRVPIDALIQYKGEDDCIQHITDERLILHVVEESVHGSIQKESVAFETPLPPLQEQLKVLAVTKCISVVHHAD